MKVASFSKIPIKVSQGFGGNGGGGMHGFGFTTFSPYQFVIAYEHGGEEPPPPPPPPGGGGGGKHIGQGSSLLILIQLVVTHPVQLSQ